MLVIILYIVSAKRNKTDNPYQVLSLEAEELEFHDTPTEAQSQ